MSSPRQYRGLRVDNREWVYGWYFSVSDKHYILPTSKGRILPLGYTDGPPTLDGFIEVHPETVGQETGLRNMNAPEIYEDDVVEMRNGTRNIIYLGQTRTDEPYEFKLQALDKSGFSFDFRNITKFIGNIHEHKNLLDKD